MKKTITTIMTVLALASGIQAQDTLYIHQKGGNITKIATAKIDSMVFYAKTTIPVQPGTIHYGTTTDQEGTTVKTVQIGNQTWFAENLKVTKYNDGTAIPNVTDATAWSNLSTGAYCNYNNEASNAATYGRLYNWYAVNTGKLCPTGWHVPSDDEWDVLRDYLIANGYNYDGTTTDDKIAKAMASTTGWQSSSDIGDIGNNPVTNNKSGLSALPGGYRSFDGTFYDIGDNGYWWSSTETNTYYAYNRYLL